ncbi:hypothetical protein SteCoe_33991 [Stentor coeruleus]|uniref:Uncharacterized protein n=1 Tax=Stentor coeruleus TaxID=5963 RepID=A0A1R2AVH8_9CILI|nr:hypothetical protein SteCoe_33991 [Stentor coeruleus]
MVEPRYTLTRAELSLKNRHMIKCYPSFADRLKDIEDYRRKVRYYQNLAKKQGDLLDFLHDTVLDKESEKEVDEEVPFFIGRLTKSVVGSRGLDFNKIPKIDTESWMKRTLSESTSFSYTVKQHGEKDKFESLHESTLYIEHYC